MFLLSTVFSFVKCAHLRQPNKTFFFVSYFCTRTYMHKKKCIYTMKRAKLNVVKTPTQCQLNNNSTKVGCDTKMTLHTTPPHHHRNSMSVISQLLLTRFWPNFKGRFQGTSRTDSNCYSYSCPGNNCPGDICPYQEYLSCCRPDFDQTLEVGWQV